MQRRVTAATSDEATAIRFAWWAAFFTTLTLVVVLGIAKSAQATTPSGGGAPLAPVPAAAEESEEEVEVSEDEGSEEEGEEECEDGAECEEEPVSGEAPRECLLVSSQATVTATANKDKIRLQFRYTTSSPTTVAVDYGLHGGKGSLYLGGEKKHVGRHGVLRLTKVLTEKQMVKAMAAKSFTVRLRVAAAPGYCQSFFDHQLDVRRVTPTGLSWQESE